MDLSELREHQQKEWELIENLKNSIGKNFTQSKCFPELHLDERMPYCSIPFPPPILVPFHKTVIVKIPSVNEEHFRKRIQFSVEELLELEEKGRVALILSQNPTDYVGLDYLDPILEKEIPISFRILAYKEYIAGKRLKSYGYEAECLFSENPVWKFDEKWKNYIKVVEGFFVDLRVCGYNEIADLLVDLSVIAPELTRQLTLLYSHTLCGNIISYGGIHALDKRHVSLFEKIKNMKNEISCDPFPYEAGVFLTNKLKLLHIPYVIGGETIERCLEVYPYYEKARKALASLDKAIEERNEDKMLDNAGEYENEMESVWKSVQKIEEKKDTASEIMQTVGVTGSITSPVLLGLPGILASSFFSVLSHKKIAEPASEYLAKVRKPAHIVTLYEFKKDVNTWLEKSEWQPNR
jgi:hypothetical protein